MDSPLELSKQNIEVWTPVLNYEGLYEVSNLGRLRSLDRYVKNKRIGFMLKRGRLLLCSPNARGYPVVDLTDTFGQTKTRKLHQVVYESFIGLYDEPVMRHLDDNKLNPALYNLLPGTAAENMSDAARNGRHGLRLRKGEQSPCSKITQKNADDIRASLAKGATGTSIAKAYGISTSMVSLIKLGRYW